MKLATPSNDRLLEAVEHLKAGGILIYPTETLYGMGVDAENPEAIKKLFQLKKRALSKPVPVLLPGQRSISKYCKNISKEASILMDEFWPGALTIVMESESFPEGVSNHGHVGFRISSHPFTQAVLSYFGKCITSTSANISDRPSPEDPQDFFKIFPKDSFFLIQDDKPSKAVKPSTVIDCTKEKYVMVRESAISKSKIDETLKKFDVQ